MSRFNHLELGNPHEGPPMAAPVTRDGAGYLTEARTAFARGNFELALRMFSRVLEFAPGQIQPWTGQVRTLIELDEPDEARQWADKALEKFPDDPELMAAKATALGRIGDLQAALPFSDAAVELFPDSPAVWLARGDVLLAARDARSGYCFDKALTLTTAGDWSVPWLASRSHSRHRQFARALKFARQALDRDATVAVLWLELGRCQLALGLRDQAADSFARAKELDPGCRPTDEQCDALATGGLWMTLRGHWRRMFQK